MRDNKLNKFLSRERVLNISLLDFFIQLIFLLVIMLGIGYFSIDKDKYDKFIKEGKELYGDSFAENWIDMINGSIKKIKANEARIKEQEQIILNLIGFNPCLDISSGWSVEFTIENGYIKFNGFSKNFLEYAKNHVNMSEYKKIKVGQNFSPNMVGAFKKEFHIFDVDKSGNNKKCYHMFYIHDFDNWVVDKQTYQQHEILRGLPYGIFKPYIKTKQNVAKLFKGN